MVQRGEYLERMALIPSGPYILEGLYHRGEVSPAVVIAPPHPKFGGSMDSAVVAEAAWALTRGGHATLRFNYRGVGASQGGWEEGREDVRDLEAMVEHLAASAPGSTVALCGYSYGGWLCCEAAARWPQVEDLALISPPLGMLDFRDPFETMVSREEGPPRVLVITGSHDEHSNPADLEELLAPLGGAARVVIVAGADHGYLRGLPEVGRQLAEFFGPRSAS